MGGDVMTTLRMHRGDQLVVYPQRRPAERLYVTVTRVAKDMAWVDVRVCTWAVMWTKRMPTSVLGEDCLLQRWDQRDLDAQEIDHMAKLGEATS